LTGIREKTLKRDKEIYDAYVAGVSPYIIAEMLKTSRGNIYNAIKRYTDPVEFRDQEFKYEAKTKRKRDE
jgi:transposase-like protein